MTREHFAEFARRYFQRTQLMAQPWKGRRAVSRRGAETRGSIWEDPTFAFLDLGAG